MLLIDAPGIDAANLFIVLFISVLQSAVSKSSVRIVLHNAGSKCTAAPAGRFRVSECEEEKTCRCIVRQWPSAMLISPLIAYAIEQVPRNVKYKTRLHSFLLPRCRNAIWSKLSRSRLTRSFCTATSAKQLNWHLCQSQLAQTL